MKKLLTAALLLATISLSGCEKPEKFSERRILASVESVSLSSKSNSKVNLRDVNSKYVWVGQRLGCSRSRASNVVVGSLWDVTEVTMYYPESKRYTTELVGTAAICTKSNE